jgi:vacuolar-type H+-ATPase subunit I/STV1
MLAWRERVHVYRQAADRQRLEDLSVELDSATTALDSEQAEVESLRAELEQQQLALNDRRDRIANLEAQRDHLRAEVDQRADELRKAESAETALLAELEEARYRALQLEEQPRQLVGQLAQANARIGELEAMLDESMAMAPEAPVPYLVSGISTDQTVFLLRGSLNTETPLPHPVHVCDNRGILLDGWISRTDGDHLIGHVARWNRPASALVKGEKVFILPGKSHEPDH